MKPKKYTGYVVETKKIKIKSDIVYSKSLNGKSDLI